MTHSMEQLLFLRRAFSAVALALLLVGTGASTLSAESYADEERASADKKAEWQGDYRKLLNDAARLERNVAAAKENYSQARQRYYPRGAARQQIVIDRKLAEKELVEVEAEIDRFKTNGRREGAAPSWFYEVEEEPRKASMPAAKAEEPAQDREGRNPLYLDDDE
jgi:hypothetical protein